MRGNLKKVFAILLMCSVVLSMSDRATIVRASADEFQAEDTGGGLSTFPEDENLIGEDDAVSENAIGGETASTENEEGSESALPGNDSEFNEETQGNNDGISEPVQDETPSSEETAPEGTEQDEPTADVPAVTDDTAAGDTNSGDATVAEDTTSDNGETGDATGDETATDEGVTDAQEQTDDPSDIWADDEPEEDLENTDADVATDDMEEKDIFDDDFWDDEEYPELSYDKTVDGYDISIYAADGVFPEGTEVKIKQVKKIGSEKIEAMIADEMNLKGKIAKIVSFDISFWHDDEEIEPEEGSVSVNITPADDFNNAVEETLDKAKEAAKQNYEDSDSEFGPETFNAEMDGEAEVNKEDIIKVFHIDDEANITEVDANIADDSTITVEADSFSVYSLVVLEPVTLLIDLTDAFNLSEVVINKAFCSEYRLDYWAKDFADDPNGVDNAMAERALRVMCSSSAKATKITVDAKDFPRIVLPKGLEIYSNKELHLEGVTLVKSGSSLCLRSAGKDGNTAGYVNKNIKIYGGTFDGASLNSGLVRMARVDGLVFSGCTFQNWYIHAVEMAGVKNCQVTNCVFKDYKGPSSMDKVQSGREALSFDMTSNDGDFSGYAPADYLPVSNITVSGCSFTSMNRALGSHHIKEGVDWENIHVTNCTFTNIYDVAVKAIGWKNSSIENCNFDSVTIGIDFKMDGKMLKASNTYTENVNSNCNVKNCNIKLSKNGGNEVYGIRLGGFDNKNGKNKNTDIAAKVYYIGGYNITDTTITGPCSSGITLQYAKNVTVSNNTVSNCATYGIWLEDNSNTTISKNKVEKVSGSGAIYVRGGSKNKVTENTITGSSSKTDGITVREGATDITVKKNKVTGGRNCIAVYEKSKSVTLESNTLKTPKNYGIQVTASSVVSKMTGNSITNSKSTGINISEKAKVSLTKDNKFSKQKSTKYVVSTEAQAIFLDGGSITIKKGKSVTLNLYGSSKKGKLKTGNKKIATVKGMKVTGKKKGKTVITATSGKLKAQITVIVK